MTQTRPWLFTTRGGYEEDLIEELRLEGDASKLVEPSLVLTQQTPKKHPCFGRQGFPLSIESEGESLIKSLVDNFLQDYQRLCAPPNLPQSGRDQTPNITQGGRDQTSNLPQAVGTGKKRPFTLQVFVPDADAANTLSARAAQLEEQLKKQVCTDEYFAKRYFDNAEKCRELEGVLWQVCLVKENKAFAGSLLCTEAPSLFPGGRARLKLRDEMPSRAALKLEEAFHWLRRAPDAGDTCVDLGAAPGGWSYVLLERRARVLAVDPAKLSPELMKRRGVKHFCQSAFQFEPPEPVLWLCCDMAWRPLEVAQLLAKWGRKKWANFLISNIKLPMKQKAEFVKELTKVIASGGWQDVTARQLYHDREEVTFGAWKGG
jgi:23S rRNA (cytidine2498-2'-O)-methyltransferase